MARDPLDDSSFSTEELRLIHMIEALERKAVLAGKLAEAVLAHNKGIATMERELTSYESEVLREKMCNLAREFQKAKEE